jgi:hypothetical protein
MSCAAPKNHSALQVTLTGGLTAQEIHSSIVGIPLVEGLGFLPAVSVR